MECEHVHAHLRPHPYGVAVAAGGGEGGLERELPSPCGPPEGAQLCLHKMLWDGGRPVVSDGKSTVLRPQMSRVPQDPAEPWRDLGGSLGIRAQDWARPGCPRSGQAGSCVKVG